MTAQDLLRRLEEACALGWLRRLDLELARFVASGAPVESCTVVLAAALVSRVESLGHVCLDLDELRRDAAHVLAWPAEALERLQPELTALFVSFGPSDCQDAVASGWVGLAETGRPQTPLVLDGSRLYLRRYWAMERRVVEQLRERARPLRLREGLLDEAQVCLDRLWGPDSRQNAQRLACERALQATFMLITGGPGTGKTYTAARLLAVLRELHVGPQALRVGLTAPTGKAAARLRTSIDEGLLSRPGPDCAETEPARPSRLTIVSGTLHGLLGVQRGTRRFRHDARQPLPLDVLLVDEASMVHLELFDAVLQALPVTSRLVLMGDSEQLASVEAGSVVGDLCLAHADSDVARQTQRLTESRRFSGAIGAAARAVNAGDEGALLGMLQQPPDDSLRRLRLNSTRAPMETTHDAVDLGKWCLSEADLPDLHTHGHWLQPLKARPETAVAFEPWATDLLRRFDTFRILCAVREGPRGVAGINEAIEREAQRRGWLPRRSVWYEGRPVMVVRNDSSLGLFNGDTGLVLRAPGNAQAADAGMRAWFLSGGRLHSVAVSRLPEVETAYAMTVHKSQGSEFDHVLLVLPDEDLPVLTRELLYTGMTRARRRLSLACREDATLVQAVRRRTWRMSGVRF